MRQEPADRNLLDAWLLPGLSKSDLDTIGCGYLCVEDIISIFAGYIVRVVPCLLGNELNEDDSITLCSRNDTDWLPEPGATICFGFAASSVQID